jgi:hypothetical protein
LPKKKHGKKRVATIEETSLQGVKEETNVKDRSITGIRPSIIK